MANNTPNLNLLKKDPVTDGNDTFNIQTMMNDNWDKIDAAVGNIDIPDASLDAKGKVQLSSATNSDAEDRAATPKAVKSAYDASVAAQATANQAFQAGNERKQEVVDALIALGVTASMADSWDTLISKMATVIRATGNATPADVLAGKTASNASGPITGTMPNRGAGGTVTPGTANQSKPAGYYSSPITVLGDADLVPGNIRQGVDLFGVVGDLESMQRYQVSIGALDVSESKTVTAPFVPKLIMALADFPSASFAYVDAYELGPDAYARITGGWSNGSLRLGAFLTTQPLPQSFEVYSYDRKFNSVTVLAISW